MPKDAYYFSHDSNARSDPKIMALINTYGIEGYGRWWVVVEMLREQCDFRLKQCEWSTNALAMAMLCDTNSAEKFIHDCVNRFELLESDDEYFWSNSLMRRMEMKEEKRQKRVEAGRKGAEKRWSDSNTITMPKQTHSNGVAMDSKESKVKESKKKVKEKKVKLAEFVSMTQDEFDKLVTTYGQKDTQKLVDILDNYKGSSGKTYKSDYRAILSWVIKRLEGEKGKTEPQQWETLRKMADKYSEVDDEPERND